MTKQKLRKFEIKEGRSADIVQENIAQLKRIFPEAFTETGLDFTVLRQLLGDAKVLNEGEEKFGLNWKGKKQARQIGLLPSYGTLLPCPQESVDWDKTQNLFIEGDNLEALKLLRRSYANKVKMIYIDPPYNTGKEFIYPDNFTEGLEAYLDYTGQRGGDGWNISKEERETTGRKHSTWLSMMLPRLRLARDLLREDGVIFISIDGNEQAHLKDICDEIFVEENFIGAFIKQSKVGGGSDTKHIVIEHEYILCYAKEISILFDFFQKYDESYLKRYRESDMRGRYFWDTFARPGLRNPIRYDVAAPDGEIISGEWIRSEERFYEDLKSGDIRFQRKKDGKWSIQFKQRLNENGKKPRSLLSETGGTIEGKESFVSLFNNAKIFHYPKAPKLIKYLISIINVSNRDIILDFFAGSCTTADAVMQLNAEDGGKRRYIMVQLPEKVEDEKSDAYRAGYKNIAEIGKERIRRAARKIQKENPDYKGDCGFKVFKLASSNIKLWNPDAHDIEQSILDYQDNLVAGRSEEDVLYELLLKRGIDLAAPIAERQIAGKNVYNIGHGKIFACLDDSFDKACLEELAAGIVAWREEAAQAGGAESILDTQIVFKDAAFGGDDVVKSNIVAALTQSGIKEQHIRSL